MTPLLRRFGAGDRADRQIQGHGGICRMSRTRVSRCCSPRRSAQRKKAVLELSKTGNNNLTEAFKDNVVLDYAGRSRATSCRPSSRNSLLDLISLYVGNMDDGHARVKMDEVRRISTTPVSPGSAARRPDSVYYYRIHSPVVLIEFDHQRPANLASSWPIHEANAGAHSRGSSDTERQRLRQGSAPPALPEARSRVTIIFWP